MKEKSNNYALIKVFCILLFLWLSCNNNFFHDLVPSGGHEIVQFKINKQIGEAIINEDNIILTFDYDNESDLKNVIPNIELASKKATLIPITPEYIERVFSPEVVKKYYSTKSTLDMSNDISASVLSTLDMSNDISSNILSMDSDKIKDTIIGMIEENKQPIPDFKDIGLPIDFRQAVVDPVQPINPVHFVVISPSIVGDNGVKVYKVVIMRVAKKVIMKDFNFNKKENPNLVKDARGVIDHLKKTIEVEVLYPSGFSTSALSSYDLIPNFDIIGDKITDAEGNIIDNETTAVDFTPQGDMSFNPVYKGLGDASMDIVVSRRGTQSITYNLHIVFAEEPPPLQGVMIKSFSFKSNKNPDLSKDAIGSIDYIKRTIEVEVLYPIGFSTTNQPPYKLIPTFDILGDAITDKKNNKLRSGITTMSLTPQGDMSFNPVYKGLGDIAMGLVVSREGSPSVNYNLHIIFAEFNKLTLPAPTLTLKDKTSKSVTFFWNSVENASGYEVYQYDTADGTDTTNPVVTTITETTATINELEANTTYYYRVKALGNVTYWDSELSTPLEVTTDKIPLDPPEPKVESVTSNSANISWDSIAHADSYEVYQSTTTYNGAYTKLTGANITITGTTTATINDLTFDVTSYYKVKAIGSGKYSSSELSNYISITAGKITLATPKLTIGVVTDVSINFSWGIIDHTDGYEVYQYNTSDGTDTKLTGANISISGTIATITGLTPNTPYNYKVKALGSGGYSSSRLSDPLPATTLRTQLSAPVLTTGTVDPVVVGSAINSGSITFSWSNIANNSGYEVYQCNSAGTPQGSPVKTLVTNISSVTISGLNVNTTYYYKAVTIGTGQYSNSDYSTTMVTLAIPKIPLATPDLTIGTVASNSVALSWGSVGVGASSYTISYSSTSSSGPWNTKSVTGTSNTIDGLEAFTTYYFKIMAIGSANYNNSSESSVKSAKTLKIKLNTPVLSISTPAARVNFVNSVGLSWTTPSNGSVPGSISMYKLWMAYTENGNYEEKSDDYTVTTANRPLLTDNDTVYYYKVIAKSGNEKYEDSAFSNIVYVALPPIPNMISGGQAHTLAILSKGNKKSGNLWAWGSKSNGVLGDGNSSGSQSSPLEISVLKPHPNNLPYTAVAGGREHSLLIDYQGRLWSSGNDNYEQLGNWTDGKSLVFARLKLYNGTGTFDTQCIAIAAGGRHSLAIGSDNAVRTWGGNDGGQLGYTTSVGSNNEMSPLQYPNRITLSSNPDTYFYAKAVAGGYSHSLAIGTDDCLYTWGYNKFGQLGRGNRTATASQDYVPTKRAAGTTFKVIATGSDSNFNLAIDTDGKLWSWGGDNNYGELGRGNRTSPSDAECVPTKITSGVGSTTFKAVAGGEFFGLALDTAGNIWSWGYNNCGQLGKSGVTNKPTNGASVPLVDQYPVQVTSGTIFTAIAAGKDHSLAIDNTGRVWAWGANYSDQLGKAGTYDTPTIVLTP